MSFDLGYVWMVLLPGMALAFWAQRRVRRAFEEASRLPSRRGYTGAEVAEAILRHEGVRGVRVGPTAGVLTDHYHPLKRLLALSEAVHSGTTLAAAGIAAHEAGHALQHARGYWPLQVRSLLVPACVAGNWIGQAAILVGALFALGTNSPWGQTLLWLGIGGYALAFLFTLITLPVEFDASRRAMAALSDQGILSADELPVAKRVLDAAALTYVASAVQVFLVLAYLLGQARRS